MNKFSVRSEREREREREREEAELMQVSSWIRVVQVDSTPEIEVFIMLFWRRNSEKKRSVKLQFPVLNTVPACRLVS